jgi:hypothetical protein
MNWTRVRRDSIPRARVGVIRCEIANEWVRRLTGAKWKWKFVDEEKNYLSIQYYCTTVKKVLKDAAVKNVNVFEQKKVNRKITYHEKLPITQVHM